MEADSSPDIALTPHYCRRLPFFETYLSSVTHRTEGVFNPLDLCSGKPERHPYRTGLAQEQQEIDRFSHVNEEFADDNLALFTTSSLLGALMPVLAAIATLIISAMAALL